MCIYVRVVDLLSQHTSKLSNVTGLVYRAPVYVTEINKMAAM